MRQLLALLLGSLALPACRSSLLTYPSGLYRTAADFRQHQLTPVGTGASRLVLACQASRQAGPGERRQLPLDSLWGYAGIDRAAYRVYRCRAYQVEQADTLAVYSVLVGTSKRSHRAYYFSSGLGGPVERLPKRRLRQAFASNPTFLALLGQLPWQQLLSDPVAGSGGYRVVALYRQALALPAA